MRIGLLISPISLLKKISSGLARGATNVIETLFGNGIPGIKGNHPLDGADLAKMGAFVLPRTLLPSSVIFSETTRSWVATVNTNQKALEANNVEESSKSLRAFSVPTQKQAMALARAWAPPQMHPFASNPTCLICEVPFTVFRRASHCRNCGVCICGPCSLQWPAKMLPVTYNIKKETTLAICKACDWLCSEFRLALLHGNLDKAVALFSTGNINLTTPFANVKGELLYVLFFPFRYTKCCILFSLNSHTLVRVSCFDSLIPFGQKNFSYPVHVSLVDVSGWC